MSRVGRAVILAIGIALGVGALVFVTINRQPVDVDLYFFSPIQLPLWLLVLGCLVIGWLVPRLLSVGYWYRRQRDRSRLRRRIDELEREVLELRNIPLDIPPKPPPVKVRRTTGAVVEQPPVELSARPRPPLLTTAEVEEGEEGDEDDVEVRPHR